MARHAGFWWALVLSGSLGSGKVSFGKYRHGVEIELENKLWVSYGLVGCCSARPAEARNGKVWTGTEIKTIK